MRRLGGRRGDPARLSVGSWRAVDSPVLAVCHPDWRGVRTAAYGHRVPVLETSDAAALVPEEISHMAEAGVEVLVIQGFPPGSDVLMEAAKSHGMRTRLVLHSSMAQYGAEPSEAEVIDTVLTLAEKGTLDKVGFVKEGQAEAFRALGHRAEWVPNRLPPQPHPAPLDLGEGRHIGVFAEPFWRKNVVTQLGAVGLLGGTAHLIHRPRIDFLDRIPIVEHGLLPYEEFLRVQGSVHLNLYVTLSESYPLSPLESYSAGVPCLASRTSSLFRDEEELWHLATVDEIDNPRAIAEAAEVLFKQRDRAVELAQAWIARWDEVATRRWDEFVA